MKTTVRILAILIALASDAVASGVPPLINLQGRLTDVNGNTITDGEHTVVFRIYADSTGLIAPLWAETLPVLVSGGLFTAIIGRTSPFPAGLYSGSPNRFLGLTVDSEPEMQRVRLNSVAYAHQSENADVAVVALDLSCVGCIDATQIAVAAVGGDEIASNAVNASEIATDAVGTSEIEVNAVGASEIDADAVGSSEIATGAVRSDEVADGSLTSVDLGDEPGVASNHNDATAIVMSGAIQTLTSRTINAPGPGYVLAIGTVSVNTGPGDGGSFGRSVLIGVSTNSGVFTGTEQYGLGISNTMYGLYTITTHRLFETPGGADSFYLLGQEVDGDFTVYSRVLTLVYFPAAYGTVAPLSTANSQDPPFQEPPRQHLGSQSITLSPQSESTETDLIQREIAKLRAEFEARLQTLEPTVKRNAPDTSREE